ncbi:MAG TPA: alpha/beta hydrolase [Nitrososphaera sp.]|jgi:pimeloyl-ACP methyl ester carboxylesterase
MSSMTIRTQTGIIISIFVSLVLVASPVGIVSFQLASAQASSDDNNNANSLNVQDIPIKKVHVGDIDIAYKSFGKGDPILLITGSNAVMDTWDPTLLKDLSSNHTVIIFDHRGVGNTTAGTKPFSMIQFANDTAGLLDALNIQKADVIGYSMGTFIGQELALLHPEKLNRLMLIAATCGGEQAIPESPEVSKIFTDIANNRLQDITKFLSVVFPESWIKSHPNNLALPPSAEIVPNDTKIQQDKVVKEWFATNWSGVCDQLSNVTIPTLLVTGTEDVAVPANNSLIIAQKIPGAWLVQFREAGHGLMYQYPEQLSTVLQTFLTTTAQAINATSTGTAAAAAGTNTTATSSNNTTITTAPTLNSTST